MQNGPRDGILDSLNPPQREAASYGDGPLLIIAGAGSGKTTTLVHRVAHLISQGVAPYRILLLTFTRRAAGEMLRRVQRVLPRSQDSRQVWGGTFHAMGTRLLRIHGESIGVNPRFSIHDRGDSEDLMKALVNELKLAKDDKKFPKKGTCMSIHSFCVNSGRELGHVLESNFWAYVDYADPLERLCAAYVQRKQDLSVMDYDDLILKWAQLLEHEEAGPRIRDRFQCVLVDEYQDTNHLQARLVGRLCPEGRGLTVVGDDAQSIYSFRAATVRNIMNFPKQFPGTKVVKLEQNYRSSQPLLEASNRVIVEAKEKYAKKLWSARERGTRPQLVACFDENEQSEFVVEQIRRHRRSGASLREQAVLFRASHHSIALETELARHDIPFVKYGGLKFVESAHVKDLLSFLRLAENRRDVVAGTRVLMLLPGIGPKKALQFTAKLGDAAGRFQIWADTKPPSKAGEIWPRFVNLMRQLADGEASDLPRQIRLALSFYQPLLEEKYDNPHTRLNDLEQLEQLAAKYTDRATMLADLAIDPPTSEADLPRTPEHEDHLILSTMHSAKGLEWQTVYVLHASDGMIPSERSFDSPEQLEEERRMLYVAMTRAADRLYVCHCENHRTSYGGWHDWDDDGFRELSRFLSPRVQEAFQCQRAMSFEEPQMHADVKPKPSRKRKRKKAKQVRGNP